MACQEWSVLPSAMGICEPKDDLVLMSAFLSAKSDMQAYERDQEERKAALRSGQTGVSQASSMSKLRR